MGRSLECIDDLPTESDWVFRAGEIDTFCESQPNKQQVRFRNLVQQFERELQDSLLKHKSHEKTHQTLNEELLKLHCALYALPSRPVLVHTPASSVRKTVRCTWRPRGRWHPWWG